MAAKHIIQVPLAQLHPHPRNARTHPKKQKGKLVGSLHRYGFVRPIVIDTNNRIVCGHGIVDAAKSVGMSHVPAIRIEHLSDAEIRAGTLLSESPTKKFEGIGAFERNRYTCT